MAIKVCLVHLWLALFTFPNWEIRKIQVRSAPRWGERDRSLFDKTVCYVCAKLKSVPHPRSSGQNARKNVSKVDASFDRINQIFGTFSSLDSLAHIDSNPPTS